MLAGMMTMSSSTSMRSDTHLSPSRIKLARERRGMSKVVLAGALGVTTRALQAYETDGAPRARLLELARVLDVVPTFLQRPERSALDEDQVSFRARRRATAYQRTAARAAGSIGIEFYGWILGRFRLPAVNLPDLDREPPERAAAHLRSVWGQGTESLPNLVQLSEANGVKVMSLPLDAETVDAFSLWQDGQPYVFLSTTKTAERSRFDLAHELGHLAMHSRGCVDGDAEREADAFASALLIPRDSLLARAGREPATPQILRLRSYYRVSAMAVTRSLHDVGRLSDWAYRQNCVSLAQMGYRSGEPGGITRELSRVFRLVLESLRANGSGPQVISDDLGLSPRDLHGFTFGQVVMPIAGGDQGTSVDRPSLRLLRGSG